MAQQESWHLDRRVPITIIGALIVQTLIFTYTGTAWKVDVDSRLAALERSDGGQASHESRIIVLEQGVLRIREDLAEIKALLRSSKTRQQDETPQ